VGELASDRALARAAAAASLVALGVLFWPAAAREVFVYGDLGNFLLPFRIFLAENLARGIAPLWMPHLFCGFYAHGDGAIGIFHPLRWLLYRFLPISEAFNLECVLPYPLALIGVALFLRRLALPASAAIFGGATFAFSAYLAVRLTHLNAIEVLAHLGWLLLAIDVLLRESGRARCFAWLGLALSTGSQLLVGYPVGVVYCWFLAIPYALFAATRCRQPWPLLAVASALAAGVALAAIQVLPTWEQIGDSHRAGASYEFLTEQSLHPLNLLTIVNPWLFQHRTYVGAGEAYNPIEQAIYLGAVVPIAGLWVLVRWRKLARQRPLVIGLFALSALALILSLGRYTDLYRYFVELPLLGALRVPARYSLAIYFAGSVFAAIAFADLVRGGSPSDPRSHSRWIWIVPAASWLVTAAALVIRDPAAGPASLAGQLSAGPWFLLAPLVFTVAAALFTSAARGRRAAAYGLVALALADQAAYAATLWWIDPPRSLAEYRAGIAPPEAPYPFRIAAAPNWMWLSDGRWWASTRFIVHDARLVSGYAALMPERRLDYSRVTALRVAGVASLVTPHRAERLSGALPRARLVSSTQQSARPAVDIETIDVANTALVEEPVDVELGPAGTAAIQQDRPGAIRIAVETPTRQLLVLAESFHPGWRAAVDGARARALRVNGDFIGVVVGPGIHEVKLRFAPRSFEVGRWTSLAGIAIVLAVAIGGMIAFPPGSARGAGESRQPRETPYA
jgi:hypothetical protein